MSPASVPEPDSTLAEELTAYRNTRRQLEQSILPMATSVDGRTFTFQASLHGLELRRGGYVALVTDGRVVLGQVTDLGAHTTTVVPGKATGGLSELRISAAIGQGRVLTPDGPFHDVPVRVATSAEMAAWSATTRRGDRAGLTIGELALAQGVPVTLDSGGFDRHTFMCGQSGSGKTYSLGLLLERLLASTTLRVVILDPNSDYVRLGRIREGADPNQSAEYAEVPGQVSVWGDGPDADHPLRLTFADLDADAQAAVLRLDPVRDLDEYAVLTELLVQREVGTPLFTSAEQLLDLETPGARALGMRAANLGILRWRIWDPQAPSLIDEIAHPTARCTVVDLGSLDTVGEQHLVAAAVLSALWAAKAAREPCLVVMDEAHNICPAAPTDQLTALSAERAVQIAAEGRKYGLYLLTSTQRPNKVHENVLSQSDNLVLMRVNGLGDLEALGRLLSFVPRSLMDGATEFRMGQALVAGKILPDPAYVQMGARVSEEGGSDVPTDWARARSQS